MLIGAFDKQVSHVAIVAGRQITFWRAKLR